MAQKIAFQGEPGAYSHQACHETHPSLTAIACRTFEDVIDTVRGGGADLAMLPVENSTYGRVADIHHLLPESGLHIVGEAFVRVHINLLVVPGTKLDQVETAMSHTVLLGQCRDFQRTGRRCITVNFRVTLVSKHFEVMLFGQIDQRLPVFHARDGTLRG